MAETDRTTSPRHATAPTRADRSRYVIVCLLLLAGLLTFVSTAFLVSSAIDATAKSFDRATIPGTISADLHPGRWNVWLEGPGRIDTVTVTDASGRPLDVRMGDGGTSYRRNGFESRAVASFDAPRGGLLTDARIDVTGLSDDPDATFAVGPSDDFSYVDVARYATIAVIAIDLVVIALIVLVPIIRTRRQR